MRKKTMAILMASAVAAAGIIGLTACSDAKGEKVTEEQWKAAITAMATAENYTAAIKVEGKETGSGKVEDKTVNYVGTSTQTGNLYLDVTAKKLLLERKTTEKITGGALIGEEDGEETGERKSYFEADGLKLWISYIYDEDTEWSVYSETHTTEAELKEDLLERGLAYSLANIKYSTTEDGEAIKISELYSAFTYNKGEYSATLYDEGDKLDIAVSFKDGYILSFTSGSNTEYTDEDDGITYKITYKTTYTFSGFGKTTVTTPEDAAAAIANKKTPKN